ncbi:hypothetical protein Ddye_003690 [Dipteronia dyeriana]|uniref:Uncharacterized protein n=1 Tax=Dipteronia dyeriana TaxID=168575 RepID=A0AAD9XSQ7_9ROSI|nr:hypothetical protein Ddye_003690 [Dipteronia dyeriana]
MINIFLKVINECNDLKEKFSVACKYIKGYMKVLLEFKRRYPNDNNLGWMKFPLIENLTFYDEEDELEGGDSNIEEATAE